jgi:uncharacterized membrane protein
MFKKILVKIAEVINLVHDLIGDYIKEHFFFINDKVLHFIIFGFIGIIIYIITHLFVRLLAKYSLKYISFIFTMTVLTVIALSLEIIQKVTNSGNMEFDDITAGLYGFMFFLIIYEGLSHLIKPKENSSKKR